MKKSSLIVSITLTILVFSMSMLSGSDSGNMSLGLTSILYDITHAIFPKISLDLDTLHVFIRKAAHVGEYSLLAISWFFTIKLWNYSLVSLLIIGLLIAGIDESIQILAEDRGPSVLDAIVYDYLPFMTISFVSYFINNRKGVNFMASETLIKLQNNTISAESAYKTLYRKERIKRVPFLKRAHFIKFSINVPGEKGVNVFLKILFFLPIPLLFARIIMGFIKMDRFDEDVPITKTELIRLISHRGVRIKVNASSGEKIHIRTI